MEIWEPEGVFGDSRLIWMIIEGMESVFRWWFREQLSLELVVLLGGVNVTSSINSGKSSLATFSRKNDNFS